MILLCQSDSWICPPFCRHWKYDVSKMSGHKMAADLRCVRQREFHTLIVVHCKLVFDATVLLRVHHERPIAGCPPDTQLYRRKDLQLLLPLSIWFEPCHPRSRQALWTATQASVQRRSIIWLILIDKLKVQEEYMMQKFIHSTHALLWVSLTSVDGPTTVNTNQVGLDLHIRPLVNLFPLAFYFLHCEIYIWTILWVSGWI